MIPEGLHEMDAECEAIDADMVNDNKFWKCPECKKERVFFEKDNTKILICNCCQVGMEVVDGLA